MCPLDDNNKKQYGYICSITIFNEHEKLYGDLTDSFPHISL